MSNCIDFVGGSEKVVFLKDEIDVVALKTLIESVKGLPKAPECDSKDNYAGYIAWWFLSRAVVDDRGAVIRFGCSGRSSHTNRDFDATLILLGRFMKKPKYHTFYVRDEGDGFRRIFREDVEFNTVVKLNGKPIQD